MTQPAYETDAKSPVDGHGWQIINAGRALYPGGPFSLRIITPEYPVFYAGWRYAWNDGQIGRNEVVVSHIGAQLHSVYIEFTPEQMLSIQARLQSYFLEYGELLTAEKITGVEFKDSDPLVEIF